MRPAAEEFRGFLDGFEFRPPRVEFIDNVTGMMERDPANIKNKLVLQLSSPVQWERSVTTAVDAGAATFIESGPGAVLAGLVKRIAKDRTIMTGEKALKNA